MDKWEPYELLILALLKRNPETVYVTSDGSRIYLLSNDELIYFAGVDLHKLTPEGVNQFIQDTITMGMIVEKSSE